MDSPSLIRCRGGILFRNDHQLTKMFGRLLATTGRYPAR